MPVCTISVEVKSRWWLPFYLKTLILFCQLIQRKPDYEKVSAFIAKYGIGQKVKTEPVKEERRTMTGDSARRPHPPVNFTGENCLPYTRLILATEIGEWVNQHILSEEGQLHNPDHTHLLDADVEFMWASGPFEKKGRYVLGQCKQVMLRAGGLHEPFYYRVR